MPLSIYQKTIADKLQKNRVILVYSRQLLTYNRLTKIII
jgi:hypothetical protein